MNMSLMALFGSDVSCCDSEFGASCRSNWSAWRTEVYCGLCFCVVCVSSYCVIVVSIGLSGVAT